MSAVVRNDLDTQGRLRAALENEPIDIGTLWEFCVHFEWTDRTHTVDAIADWLGSPDGLRVIDCACGSGFPSLALMSRGYDVTCSDGSASMLEHLAHNARREGVAVEPVLLRWEKLAARYESTFDVVMCRGASFPYAGTWDDETWPDRDALVTAMGQFVRALRPGGRLYLDTTRAEDLARSQPQVVAHPRLVVGRHQVDLEETLTNHPRERIRTWRTRLTVDGTTHEFERRSHYLPGGELVELMTGAGLVDVGPIPVDGEHYEVYSGRRV